MKNLTAREKQSIATKLKIIQISTDLFKQKGFETVKIQEICEKAEISVGAFYHHFKSKNEIINTGYAQVDLLVKERLSSKIFNSHIEKIISLLSEGCEVLTDLGYLFVSDVYKNLLHIDEKYSFDPTRYVNLEIKSAINLAKENKELREDISTEDLSETLLRISRGVIFDWCLHQGNYNLKEKMIFDSTLILSIYKC